MSNEQVNKTGLNCANKGNENVCDAEKLQVTRNHVNNNEEFASDFDKNLQTNSLNNNANLTSNSFNTNSPKTPVSERTAWH